MSDSAASTPPTAVSDSAPSRPPVVVSDSAVAASTPILLPSRDALLRNWYDAASAYSSIVDSAVSAPPPTVAVKEVKLTVIYGVAAGHLISRGSLADFRQILSVRFGIDARSMVIYGVRSGSFLIDSEELFLASHESGIIILTTPGISPGIEKKSPKVAVFWVVQNVLLPNNYSIDKIIDAVSLFTNTLGTMSQCHVMTTSALHTCKRSFKLSKSPQYTCHDMKTSLAFGKYVEEAVSNNEHIVFMMLSREYSYLVDIARAAGRKIHIVNMTGHKVASYGKCESIRKFSSLFDGLTPDRVAKAKKKTSKKMDDEPGGKEKKADDELGPGGEVWDLKE